MMCSVSREPRKFVFSLKFVVSTTSVSPSQCRARVAVVSADGRPDVRRGADRNDARVVNHLVGDRDGARTLDDAQVGVVDGREDGAGDAAGDAALPEAQILRPVEDRRAAERAQPGKRARRRRRGRVRGRPLLHRRRQSAVRRIDDQRRASRHLAALEPVRRRRRGGADGAGVASDRRSRGRSRSCRTASCLSACARRCANSASVRNRRSPYCAGRSNGTLSSASLLQVPCRSGSPHGVLGTAGPCADVTLPSDGGNQSGESSRHRDHTPRPHLGSPRWSVSIGLEHCACLRVAARPKTAQITASSRAPCRRGWTRAQSVRRRAVVPSSDRLNRVQKRGVLVAGAFQLRERLRRAGPARRAAWPCSTRPHTRFGAAARARRACAVRPRAAHLREARRLERTHPRQVRRHHRAELILLQRLVEPAGELERHRVVGARDLQVRVQLHRFAAFLDRFGRARLATSGRATVVAGSVGSSGSTCDPCVRARRVPCRGA